MGRVIREREVDRRAAMKTEVRMLVFTVMLRQEFEALVRGKEERKRHQP